MADPIWPDHSKVTVSLGDWKRMLNDVAERDRLRKLATAVCANPSETDDYECVRASDLDALRGALAKSEEQA